MRLACSAKQGPNTTGSVNVLTLYRPSTPQRTCEAGNANPSRSAWRLDPCCIRRLPESRSATPPPRFSRRLRGRSPALDASPVPFAMAVIIDIESIYRDFGAAGIGGLGAVALAGLNAGTGRAPIANTRLSRCAQVRRRRRSPGAVSPHSLWLPAAATRALGTTRARSGLAGANTP